MVAGRGLRLVIVTLFGLTVYSIINVCIIIIYSVGLYRVVKATYTYNLGKTLKSIAVEHILKETSLVPTMVCVSNPLLYNTQKDC